MPDRPTRTWSHPLSEREKRRNTAAGPPGGDHIRRCAAIVLLHASSNQKRLSILGKKPKSKGGSNPTVIVRVLIERDSLISLRRCGATRLEEIMRTDGD